MSVRTLRWTLSVLCLLTALTALAACSSAATPAPQVAPTQAAKAPEPAKATEAPKPAQPTTAPAAQPTAVPATKAAEQPKAATSGSLPAGAAPADKQVFRTIGIEGKHFDTSRNTYEANGMGLPAWEPLVNVGGDLKIRPGAADRWETSADGLKWTFYLRKTAKWSDGSPVTAQDWVYTFQRALKKETANPYAWFYASINNAADLTAGKITDVAQLGVRAVDDTTLEFTTKAPTPYFLQILAFPTSVPVQKKVVEKEGDAWASKVETAISNGPFKISEWKKGQSYTLVKNPEYNGPNPAKLEKVVVQFIPQSSTPPTLQMYQANEIDYTSVDPTLLPQALANPAFKDQLDVFPNFVTYYMYFNTDQPPFNDKRVRQAFSHAIDRESIATQVMQGLDLPAYTHLPPGFLCNQANDPDVRKIQAYDPALAKKLMADAGFPDGKGFPQLELWIRQGQVAREAEAVQRMLKQNLGVDVTVKDVERSLYMQKLGAKEITLGLIQWYYDYADPTNFMDWWTTGARHTWKNEEFNTLVKAAGTELDQTKRCKMYNQAERILIEDVGAVFVAHPSMGELWKPNVAGLQANPDGKRVHYPIMFSDIFMK
ncbi:MAG: hypothetical protein KIT87_04350 [Anaerolineae bacterium]|nr:hypothetical protein [Anaerolineae bacterium]